MSDVKNLNNSVVKETVFDDPHARYNNTMQNHANKVIKTVNNEVEEWIDDFQTSEENKNLKQETLEEAFNNLRNNIATNANDAQAGDWCKISDNKTKYWTDNPLRFTKHEKTGAYLIEQQDENGNWVAMGYTDKDTVYSYLNKIKNITQPEKEEKPEEKTENKTEKKEKTVQKVKKSDISNEVHKEVEAFLKLMILPTERKRSPEYKALSETAKKIVDGEIVFKTNKECYMEAIENGEEFVVPKGVLIANTGKARNIIEGEKINFNSDKKGKAIVTFSNGAKQYYDIEKLKNVTFTTMTGSNSNGINVDNTPYW